MLYYKNCIFSCLQKIYSDVLRILVINSLKDNLKDNLDCNVCQ